MDEIDYDDPEISAQLDAICQRAQLDDVAFTVDRLTQDFATERIELYSVEVTVEQHTNGELGMTLLCPKTAYDIDGAAIDIDDIASPYTTNITAGPDLSPLRTSPETLDSDRIALSVAKCRDWAERRTAELRQKGLLFS